ncbi:MAG: hypothetical protein ACKVZJ_10785 [Phycisphaerales bacterium]
MTIVATLIAPLIASLAPLWIGLPVAGAMMLLVAAHALAIADTDHPPSRKRIRQANAVLILLTVPLITIGVCVLSPQQHPREWALVWMGTFGMIALVIGLAIADMLNTLRLLRAARARLRSELFNKPRVDRGTPGTASADGSDAPC